MSSPKTAALPTIPAAALALVLLVLPGLAQGVLINELSLGAVDWCEIVNLGSAPVDVSGWTLFLYDDPLSQAQFTFPSPTVIGPNGVIVVSESLTAPAVPASATRLHSTAISWAANSGGAAALVDALGVGKDLVIFNGGLNLPPGNPPAPFAGTLIAFPGELLFRHANVDTDSAADFSGASQAPPTPGILNAGQTPILGSSPVADFIAASTHAIVGVDVQFSDLSSGQPQSWDWDLDGDGQSDAVVSDPRYSYAIPGVYDVGLTVANPMGADTLVKNSYLVVTAPSSVPSPYQQDFDALTLPGSGAEWLMLPDTTVAGGQATVVTSANPSPLSGASSLLLAAGQAGIVSENRAILFLDGSTPVGALRYWYRGVNEGSDPEDGLFLTSPGQPLIPVASHAGLGAFWTEVEVDLGAAITAAGLAGQADLRLVFRQRGDQPPPFGGSYIDDLQLLAPLVGGPAGPGQANQVTASLDIPGALNGNGQPASLGTAGPFTYLGTQAQIEINGPPDRLYFLFWGPLNPGNILLPPSGQLDLGLLGALNDFSDVLMILGPGGTAFFTLFANTGPTGMVTLGLDLRGLPSGSFGAIQGAVYHSGPSIIDLTAAIELVVP
ncbi:MAG: lamin tail domain-containing protein [Planctomycetes bacterium]|nr:lamin tail domain-containing protein [Planctomycetota bacterium]